MAKHPSQPQIPADEDSNGPLSVADASQADLLRMVYVELRSQKVVLRDTKAMTEGLRADVQALTTSVAVLKTEVEQVKQKQQEHSSTIRRLEISDASKETAAVPAQTPTQLNAEWVLKLVGLVGLIVAAAAWGRNVLGGTLPHQEPAAQESHK